jgi:hypothetical protein
LVFVVGVFLSNFPEALASAATMKQVVVWLALALALGLAACLWVCLSAFIYGVCGVRTCMNA